MNNSFKVVYSAEFIKDLYSITVYIRDRLRNNIAANNLLNKVEKEIIRRAQNPLEYEKYKTKGENIYYKIYINNYIIFYTVEDNTMTLRSMYYARRNLKQLLDEN